MTRNEKIELLKAIANGTKLIRDLVPEADFDDSLLTDEERSRMTEISIKAGQPYNLSLLSDDELRYILAIQKRLGIS